MTDLNPEGLPEGGSIRVLVNRYERNYSNRAACIEIQGSSCLACGFNFEEAYGTKLSFMPFTMMAVAKALRDQGIGSAAYLKWEAGLLDSRKIDKRWVRIRRPTIVAGGE